MDLTQSTLIASIYPGRKSQYQKNLANEIVIWNLRGWQMAKTSRLNVQFVMNKLKLPPMFYCADLKNPPPHLSMVFKD